MVKKALLDFINFKGVWQGGVFYAYIRLLVGVPHSHLKMLGGMLTFNKHTLILSQDPAMWSPETLLLCHSSPQ